MVDITEDRISRLEEAASRLELSADRFERSLMGAPDEGNIGVITRLGKLEKQMLALMFSFPLLVAGGAAIGHIVASFMGMG